MSFLNSAGLFDAIPDSVLTQDLLAWYRFEDGDARDYASNAEFPNITWGDSTAYDGTVSGATFLSSDGVTDFDTGPNSGAFDFDGAGDHIDIGNPSIDKTNKIFAIAAWFETSGTGFRRLISNFNSVDAYYALEWDVDGAGKLSFSLRDSGRNLNRVTSSSTLNDGNLHHVVGATDGGTAELFIDGSSEDTTSVTVGSVDSGAESYIGASPSLTFTFDGLIDDVRYYDRAITASEAADIFNSTKP